VHFIDP
jgi:hypothetical protein